MKIEKLEIVKSLWLDIKIFGSWPHRTADVFSACLCYITAEKLLRNLGRFYSCKYLWFWRSLRELISSREDNRLPEEQTAVVKEKWGKKECLWPIPLLEHSKSAESPAACLLCICKTASEQCSPKNCEGSNTNI